MTKSQGIQSSMSEDVIRYVKGTGKQNKAVYLVGAEKVPAAVVTRLLTALSGQTGAKLDSIFYPGLKKYPLVVDAMVSYGLAPESVVEAFTKLQEENQKAHAPKQERASKVEKAAEIFGKGICKRFRGTPEEMVDAFLETVSKPEFRTEAMDVISTYEKTCGKTKLGFIKTSTRKANPAAQKGLAKYQAERKKNK